MKIRVSRVKQPNKFDFILAGIILCIFVSSILAIYGSFPLLSSYLSGPNLLFKQVQFYLLGFVVIGVLMYFSNDNLQEFAIIAYKIILGMLIYLFIDSFFIQRFIGRSILPFVNTVNGATSWFSFPFLGTLQPSEFMKVVLIIISANIIIEHNSTKQDDSFESDIELFKEILKWALAPLILIFLQPDTGICIIIVFSISLMLALSGIRKEWIFGLLIVAAIGLLIFFYLFYNDQTTFVKIFGSSYKVRRFYGWLYPEKCQNSDGLQLYSSLLSLGSAGFTGHGLQSGIISIPEAHTDFIFAVIGLDFGLLGTLIVLGLCAALDIRLAQIATRCTNNIEKIMIVGFLGMLILQQLENIGMVVGYFPITGVTLPLISYGGSSLLSYMIAFGIIFNASSRAKKLSDYVYD